MDEKLPGPEFTKIEKSVPKFTLYFFIRFNIFKKRKSIGHLYNKDYAKIIQSAKIAKEANVIQPF